MSSLRQILAEKMENKNHEGLLKHPVYYTITKYNTECLHALGHCAINVCSKH